MSVKGKSDLAVISLSPTSSEAAQIERLSRRCLPEFRDHPDLIQEKLFPFYDNPTENRLGVFVKDRLIGYCVTSQFTSPKDDPCGGVRVVLVDPNYRRKGIGSELIARAEVQFILAGAKHSWLYVTPSNYLYPGAPAQDAGIYAFAQALGYRSQQNTIDIGVDLLAERQWPCMDSVSLLKVGAGNAPWPNQALKAVVRKVFPRFAEEVERALSAPEPIAYVALDGEAIIGFCVAGAMNLPLGGIGPAAVLTDYRGGPVFRCLVQACMLALKERGHPFARMQWADSRALPFYKRWFDGFICGEYRIYSKDLQCASITPKRPSPDP